MLQKETMPDTFENFQEPQYAYCNWKWTLGLPPHLKRRPYCPDKTRAESRSVPQI